LPLSRLATNVLTMSNLGCLLVVSGLVIVAPNVGNAQQTSNSDRHFDRVLIIVLENQSYVSAIKDKYLKLLSEEGTEFTDFRGVAHPSYPNYLAMISGSTFGLHGLFGDYQKDFPDDPQHRTIADLMDWKNGSERESVEPLDFGGFRSWV
jgi:hypothetical protein